MMSVEEAVRHLRSQPEMAQRMMDAYLGEDLQESATRFFDSAEFHEVQRLLEGRLTGRSVLDLGAGNGIASYAFARAGASEVYALEPEPSQEIGRGAITHLTQGMGVRVLDASGESIPLPDGALDIVYTRQVLHHILDLPKVLKECARVLKKGGIFLACREHIVDNPRQMEVFLKNHPVHALAGGENAYPLPAYLRAIRSAGFQVQSVFKTYDNIINVYPGLRSARELASYPKTTLEVKFGTWAGKLVLFPGLAFLIRLRLNKALPGRLYSFLALKP